MANTSTPITEGAIALGSNVGHRLQHLRQALAKLQRTLGTAGQPSRIYQTPAIDCPEPFPFLNAVWIFHSSLSPNEILRLCSRVETESGRARVYPNAPRTLDLDLLYVGQTLVSTPSLTLPHPRMHQRLFVLMPLAELRPDWVHPTFGAPMAQMIQANLEKQPHHGIIPTDYTWELQETVPDKTPT